MLPNHHNQQSSSMGGGWGMQQGSQHSQPVLPQPQYSPFSQYQQAPAPISQYFSTPPAYPPGMALQQQYQNPAQFSGHQNHYPQPIMQQQGGQMNGSAQFGGYQHQQQQAPRATQMQTRLAAPPQPNVDPSDPSAYCNLFVAPLPKSVRNDDLLAVFQPYRATHASVMMDVHTGRSKGFGFVSFENPSEGQAALQALQGATLVAPTGEPFRINISASHHKKSTSLNESRHVYFRNLPTNLTEDEIRHVLSQFGEITQLQVKLDNQQRWLLASVEYRSVDMAKNAVERGHGKVLFPNHSTFPVMTKFADNYLTKVARRERRDGGKDVSAPTMMPPSGFQQHPYVDAAQLRPMDVSIVPVGRPSVELVNIETTLTLSTLPASDPMKEDPLTVSSNSRLVRSDSSLSDDRSESGSSHSSGRYRRNPYNNEAVTVTIE